MTTRTLVCCDRCGITIEPAKRSTISHSKLQVTTFDREYINAPMDLCERCTQSLKMWLGNLPSRQVMYRQEFPEPLKDGTIADVIWRIEEGASLGDFRRKEWFGDERAGLRVGDATKLVRMMGDGRTLGAIGSDDFWAEDWMENRLDEGEDEEDEEGGA